jgi:hypothetical protein
VAGPRQTWVIAPGESLVTLRIWYQALTELFELRHLREIAIAGLNRVAFLVEYNLRGSQAHVFGSS